MAKEGVIHLSGGGGVGEGGKAGRGSAHDHFLDRPDGAGSGQCQEGLPVGGLCSFDGLKVTPLGKTRRILVSGEAGGASNPGGRVEFATQDGEKGGPPGLGSVRGSFDRGVGMLGVTYAVTYSSRLDLL